MSVLVLGAEGMLGAALCRELARRNPAGGTVATVRGRAPRLALPDGLTLAPEVDAMRLPSVAAALDAHRPHTVVNAIGLVKNRPEAADARTVMALNALFPHHLKELCRARDCRLIHISTDCVFDGTRGDYGERDQPDACDLYGRSKALGEVTGHDVLTLRTSMIGFEGHTRRGLLAWFLGAQGIVRGHTNAIFTGPSAPELARIIATIIEAPGPFGGLLHAAAEPIDKFALLTMVRDVFGLETAIVPDGSVRIDRSLYATHLANRYGYTAPSWRSMIEELAEIWRREHVAGAAEARVPA